MGKQNAPLILGFVSNAAKNTFGVSQKQAQNKNSQKPQQQSRSVVNNKANTKGTQSFKNWADELPKQTNWNKVVKQQNTKAQQQRPKVQQQAKQVQKQQQTNTPPPTWGWYPASKQEVELKKYYKSNNSSTNNNVQNKPQNVRNTPVMNNKVKREAQVSKRKQMVKKEPNVMKNMNNLYDAFNITFPSENGRRAWISSNKVGSDKVLSVATLFAIRNAPVTKNKKAFVERDGKVIFNNNCIRHAVEGRFTGHKKFRGTRVLTYIPDKWLCQENGYAKATNYEKYANINGPKRNEKCFSFKGVY